MKVSLKQFKTLKYEEFVADRIVKKTVSLFEPIKANKLPLFNCPTAKTRKGALAQQVSTLKQNCSLFSQLYISCQVREGNLDQFFSHENQNFPPSISQNGNLRFGQKSELLDCMEDKVQTVVISDVPVVNAKIFDGAAIVNMLKPLRNSTFEDYARLVFVAYFENKLKSIDRLDLVWDTYKPDSLKEMTREKRSKGVRRRVSSTTKVPANWNDFLRMGENKKELFSYLAQEICKINSDKLVISTIDESALCNQAIDLSGQLSPCNHEEADTRIFVHAKDIYQKCMKKIMIRTVDTDVVVLAVYAMNELIFDEMWIHFGVGKKSRFIPVHEIHRSLGIDKANALPIFHALTGCDQTSSFSGRSKKSAWSTWQVFEELTTVLISIHRCPSEEQVKTIFPVIERFVVLLYDRTSTCSTVNEIRKELFTRKGRMIDSIPPTQMHCGIT